MSKTTSESTPNAPPTFEAGLQELESIVKEMETGELPLERAIAAADGIDYIESSSALGLSTITIRLKLNYDANKALSEISSKVN